MTVSSQEFVDISIDRDILTATAKHPFWVAACKAWIDAEDLVPGDLLLSANGTAVLVEAVKPYTVAFQTVNNLTVDDLHTYYVVVDDSSVLVHNCAAPVGAADPKAVVNALSGWNSRRFFVNGQNLLLDKAGLKHILERHHPSFWNGKNKQSQSFFPKNMSVREIEHAISEVLKQNPTQIGKVGANGVGHMTGVVNSVRYQLGLNRGRIGQFFPILD